MRTLLAVLLSATIFLYTFVAQTNAQKGSQPSQGSAAPSSAPAPLNLNGVWESLNAEHGVSPRNTVNVAVNSPWTDTKMKVVKGQSLSISATGEMNWYTGGCPGTPANCTVTPDGRDWSVCASFGQGIVAQKLNCWSLIGRIGDSPIFEVGSSLNNFTARASGELMLGVNDAGGGFADNTGAWRADITLTPGLDHFLIGVNGHVVKMCSTDDQKTCLDHTTYTGELGNDPSKVKLSAESVGANPAKLLTVVDFDHLKGPQGIYTRSYPRAGDVTCDSHNTANVTPEFAILRSQDAHRHNNPAVGACWMWTAAQAGDARAQALMAFLYIAGDGVPKSLPDAGAWARKSAAQGDAFGQIILGGMYQSNEISGPANPEEKKARIAEGNEQLTRLEREQGIPAPARVIDGNAAGREAMMILALGFAKEIAKQDKADEEEKERMKELYPHFPN
jgi:hypothetical protein